MDLIDTLWNVKHGACADLQRCNCRFNRYIVECKGTRINKVAIRQQDLIDTLWNVKFSNQQLQIIVRCTI